MKCDACLDKVACLIAAPIKCVTQKPCMYSFVMALTLPVFAWKNKKRLIISTICASLILPNFADHTVLYITAGVCTFYACKFFETLESIVGEEPNKKIT